MSRTEASGAGGSLSRRRFVAIAGAVAGAALLPGGAGAAVPLRRWRGLALGANASIALAHPDAAAADRLIARCVLEVRRLERIFSLYDPQSVLVRLNRDGAVDRPPLELVELLGRAREISVDTDGAFDITVQPLWVRYAEHFTRPGAASTEPDIGDALALVDWRRLQFEPGRVAFARAGMAVTLNGIAQGFITDAVSALLRREGMARVLVDMGEIRAVGRHPNGRPWQVGIADPLGRAELAGMLQLQDQALATSGGYGTVFDDAGRYGHLIDPRSGRTAPVARGISVLAGDATTADALSTAFSLMDETDIVAVLSRSHGVRAYLSDRRGLRELCA